MINFLLLGRLLDVFKGLLLALLILLAVLAAAHTLGMDMVEATFAGTLIGIPLILVAGLYTVGHELNRERLPQLFFYGSNNAVAWALYLSTIGINYLYWNGYHALVVTGPMTGLAAYILCGLYTIHVDKQNQPDEDLL